MMFNRFIIISVALPVVAAGGFTEDQSELAPGSEYAGTKTCSRCHSEINEVFMKSGHPYKLNPVIDNQPRTIRTPKSLNYPWDIPGKTLLL